MRQHWHRYDSGTNVSDSRSAATSESRLRRQSRPGRRRPGVTVTVTNRCYTPAAWPSRRLTRGLARRRAAAVPGTVTPLTVAAVTVTAAKVTTTRRRPEQGPCRVRDGPPSRAGARQGSGQPGLSHGLVRRIKGTTRSQRRLPVKMPVLRQVQNEMFTFYFRHSETLRVL